MNDLDKRGARVTCGYGLMFTPPSHLANLYPIRL